MTLHAGLVDVLFVRRITFYQKWGDYLFRTPKSRQLDGTLAKLICSECLTGPVPSKFPRAS